MEPIMDKIAVLIPCYNEEQTVEKVVTDWKTALPEATIYVYNNNSKDRTAELAEKAGAVVRNEYKQGKGNVIRRMFREIEAECYVMVDGDDTYPADCAREMVDHVLNRKVDMVVGMSMPATRPATMDAANRDSSTFTRRKHMTSSATTATTTGLVKIMEITSL